MKKAEKIAKHINEKFSECLQKTFKEKFSVEIKTDFSIINMNLVSRRVDDKKLLKKHRDFVEAFERGYLEAMSMADEID